MNKSDLDLQIFLMVKEEKFQSRVGFPDRLLGNKTCAQIHREDFPDLTWWDIRWVLEEAGTSSSRGLMQEISNKLNKACKTVSDKNLTNDLLRVSKLSRQLYERGKEDYKKLDKIRKAIES